MVRRADRIRIHDDAPLSVRLRHLRGKEGVVIESGLYASLVQVGRGAGMYWLENGWFDRIDPFKRAMEEALDK